MEAEIYDASAPCRLHRRRGLLPEVNRRRLFEKKGFQTILEFAAKLAGVGEKQLDMVLNLEKRFQDKPDLHKALVNGEVSVNKLARVVSISTPENQSFLAEQVKILPQKALETFVRGEKSLRAQELGEQCGFATRDLDTISNQNLIVAGSKRKTA